MFLIQEKIKQLINFVGHKKRHLKKKIKNKIKKRNKIQGRDKKT